MKNDKDLFSKVLVVLVMVYAGLSAGICLFAAVIEFAHRHYRMGARLVVVAIGCAVIAELHRVWQLQLRKWFAKWQSN